MNRISGVGELTYGMEKLKADIEEFCSNVEGLKDFYKEVLEKTQAGLSVPATPMTGKPMLGRESSIEDKEIPEIGLGPSWIGGGGFGGGSLRETPSTMGSSAHPASAWRQEGFGSLRAPPFRRGSEHASDAGSVLGGQGAPPGSPLVNVERNGEKSPEKEK